MAQHIVLVDDGMCVSFFLSRIISLLCFPVQLHIKACFSFCFPSFSNDKNWRLLAAS